jgi:hypothetical protein
MAEYSRLAKGSFTSTGAAQIVNLPFIPDTIKMWNYTASATPATNGVVKGYWDVSMGQGFGIIDVYIANNATPAYFLGTDIVSSNGFSTFSAGNILQYGAAINITDITKASPAAVTTGTVHGLKTGDVVILQNLTQSATTGMQQIAGIPFTVTVTGTTTFTIPWNTNQSNYTVYADGTATAQATMVKVLYPSLYFPGANVITSITTGTTTTINTTSAHNFVVGQEVAFRVPTVWGTTQLNSLPNSTIPGSPIYGYVTSVTDYNTVVVNINSTGYTAFDSNQPFADYSGQQFPQIVAVGDVNTGGVAVSAGSALYPPPYSVNTGTTRVNTINGPAILGSYVNNSAQGFIIGAGTGATQTSAVLVGANGNVIYWEATLHDLVSP